MRPNQTLGVPPAPAPASSARSAIFTSESVAEGHPDKLCDFIADSILDAHLAQDPNSRVGCDVFCTHERVVLTGTIISRASVDVSAIARAAIREIGYTDTSAGFNSEQVHLHNLVTTLLPDLAEGLGKPLDAGVSEHTLVFGFATWETPELLPLPISLAHRLTRGLAEARKANMVPWLGLDARTQVSVRYSGGLPVEVTTVGLFVQHTLEPSWAEIFEFVQQQILPLALGERHRTGINLFVNPTGKFITGGPERQAGATGRKLGHDTYGGYARQSGAGFSGKDPSWLDRSAAYFARFVARQLIQEGLADCAELQVAYALGAAEPVSISVDTRGTGNDQQAEEFARRFDFRPAAILEQLDLRKPIYSRTTNYGHFGKPALPWEN